VQNGKDVMTSEEAGSDHLLIDRFDRIALLTLNRPQARNALDSALIAALRAGVATAEADTSVDVVVITGADPAFCAGLDLQEMSDPDSELHRSLVDGSAPRAPWEPGAKPVIGAINGPCITGGLEIALHCDFLVASDRARFADTHVKVNAMPRWGMPVLLARAVGKSLAERMSLTGSPLDAAEALAAGLVTEVVGHSELLPRVSEIARSITGHDQRTVTTLASIYRTIESDANRTGLMIEEETGDRWFRTEF
jgi:enoyl-CoA hydratase